MNQSQTKICNKCHTEKPIEDFRIRKDNNRPRGACRACENNRQRMYSKTPKAKQKAKAKYEKQKEMGLRKKYDADQYQRDKASGKRQEYLEKNKEKLQEYEVNRHVEKLDQRLWQGAKSRAEKKGLAFNLEVSDIKIPNLCPVLKIPMYSGAGQGGIHDGSPTLDRKVPHLGYTKGNVLVISSLANRIKQNATSAQVRQVADYIEQIEQENT